MKSLVGLIFCGDDSNKQLGIPVFLGACEFDSHISIIWQFLQFFFFTGTTQEVMGKYFYSKEIGVYVFGTCILYFWLNVS